MPHALLLFTACVTHAEYRLAVVDVNRAIRESTEAKALFAQAKADLNTLESNLAALERELRDLGGRLQDAADTMTDVERLKASNEIRQKRLDYDFGKKKLQKTSRDKEQEIVENVMPAFRQALNDRIEIEGYDLVLESTQLIYANPDKDITKRVISEMDETRDRAAR